MGAPTSLPSERTEGEIPQSTIPQNLEVGTPVADFMNGNVTRWNEMTRGLVRSNPSQLRPMDLENMLRMIDHLVLTRDGIHFNTQQGRHWINDVFHWINDVLQ